MDEMDSVDEISVVDSCDMMWDAIQVDLDVNRSHQNEQLQALKGKILRISRGKQNVQKRAKHSKKFLRKKALLKALDTIKAFTTKGFKNFGSRRKMNSHVKSSNLNFEVCYKPSEIGNESTPYHKSANLDQLSQRNGHSTGSESPFRDQSMQTDHYVLEDKFSQTTLSGGPSESAERITHEVVSPHFPVYMAPLSCGTCVHACSRNACCAGSKTHVCSCSSSQHTIHCSDMSRVMHEGVQTENLSISNSQHSLEEMCRELLAQLCEKINSCPKTASSTNVSAHNKAGCPSEDSSSPPNVGSMDLGSPTAALQFLKSCLGSLFTSEKSPSPVAPNLSAVTVCQASMFVPSQAAIFTESESQRRTAAINTATISELASELPRSSITPDLLRDNEIHRTTIIKDRNAKHHAETPSNEAKNMRTGRLEEASSSETISKQGSLSPKIFYQQPKVFSSLNAKQQLNSLQDVSENSNQTSQQSHGRNQMMNATLEYSQKKINKSLNITSGINENGDDNTSSPSASENTSSSVNNSSNESTNETLSVGEKGNSLSPNLRRNGIMKSTNSLGSSDSDDRKATVSNAGSIVDNARAKVAKSLFDESVSSNASGVRNLMTEVNSAENISNDLNIEVNEVLKKTHHNLNASDTQDMLNKGKNFNISLEESSNKLEAKKQTEAADREVKGLAKVNAAEITNLSRKMVNSPAFEEMDPSEMESVLLIWRQQELLHQGNQQTQTPGFMFKKTKKHRELPPELRSFKVLHSAPPEKTMNTSNSSALDILDEEAKRSTIEEDDDVPENSPKPVIQPPKRRKLSLKLNPPLPIVFEKNKEAEEKLRSKDQATISPVNKLSPPAHNTRGRLLSAEKLEKPVGQEENLSDVSAELSEAPLAQRVSKKVKQKDTTSKTEVKKNPQSKSNEKQKKSKELKLSASKKCSEKKASKEDKMKVVESKISSTVVPKSDSRKANQDNNMGEEFLRRAEENIEDKIPFEDQIQERVHKLKQRWLLERSNDEGQDTDSVNGLTPSVLPSSPARSQITVCDQGVLLSEEKMPTLKDVPIVEIGKAHDVVTYIILNPWRGITAKHVTRGFVCPKYDTKSVTRALWDLRSNAVPTDVAERIISLGLKGIHPHAYKAMVSLFILSLTRLVPFVIEASAADEDDNLSLSSDAEQMTKKKSTPVRLVATKQIFKGECIEGLNGLLVKVPTEEKEKLRSWNFPKFQQGRDWAIFGPLAYLKRKESSNNTEALFLRGELVVVKATRQILSGEKLSVSFKELERSLCK